MQEVFEKIIEKQEELFQDLNVIEVLSHVDFDSTIQNSLKNFLKSITKESIEIVKQEAEKYNNGWIPCSERLPEPIRPVLVTLRNWMNDKYFVRVGRFHTDHWKTDEGIVENSVVLAWQPLPQPYQPKGE